MLDRRILWTGVGAGALGAVLSVSSQPLAALAAAAAAGVCAWAAYRGRTTWQDRTAPEPVLNPEGLEALAPLLEALPDPALMVDADGRVAGSNAAARRDLAFEAAGLFLSSILRHPDLLEAVNGAVRDGATRTVEYETAAAHVDQHTRCYVAPVTWGGARAAMLVFHDQTARINTERTRADFLANASHELRTPLAALKLSLETIAGPAREDPEARDKFIKLMQTHAERMSRLIDDLLALSRIELDEHVPPHDRADLAAVAGETVDALAAVAAQRNVTLKLTAPASGAYVVGDRFQLAQVLQNLVDNAVKFTAEGSVVEVEVGGADNREQAVEQAGRRWTDSARIALLTPAPAPDRSYVYVRVVDAGPGVPRRFLPRLGERFYRVERETGAERTGTGLGLAIVKHIVNRHRGGFVIESQPGKGSAFAAYFERAQQAAAVSVERAGA